MLSSCLDAPVDNGIVVRLRYSDEPPRNSYGLAQAGRELLSILMPLTASGRLLGISAG